MYTTRAEGPYAPLICQFIAKQFPRQDAFDRGDIVDLLEAELYATKQVRYGPKPKPESQVLIRDTIRKYVGDYRPLPIVIPWGSEKPDGSSIDVAELMAVQELADLDARIRRHYSQGTDIRIRIEDASAPHLFYWRMDAARAEAKRYTEDMRSLVSVLGLPITIAAESDKISEEEFNLHADARLPAFEKAMLLRDASYLQEWGWKGGLNHAMLDYYLASYAKLYPAMSDRDKVLMLARYFAGASARSMLGLRGDKPEWGGNYLEVSFVAPIPGTEGHFGKRVHYRTLPLHFTSNHIPPWRAKGYFHISDDDELTPKLTTFGDNSTELVSCSVELRDETTFQSVSVQTDYTAA